MRHSKLIFHAQVVKVSMIECPTGRRSGRTTWLLNMLLTDIKEGTPQAIVVAKNPIRLQDIFLKMAQRAYLDVVKYEKGRIMIGEDQVIYFFRPTYFEVYKTMGLNNKWESVYIDHYAIGED